MKLYLASASPRRLELLKQVGITPDKVVPADIDESAHKNEKPEIYAARIASEKAKKVAQDGVIILSADTVVACGRRILPKAETEEQARACLDILSGRRHRVITAVSIITAEGKQRTRVVTTVVQFKRLAKKEIDTYITSGEWHGKAGGYAIQGRAAALISFISGSYSAVVGLPLHETCAMLSGAGYEF